MKQQTFEFHKELCCCLSIAIFVTVCFTAALLHLYFTAGAELYTNKEVLNQFEPELLEGVVIYSFNHTIPHKNIISWNLPKNKVYLGAYKPVWEIILIDVNEKDLRRERLDVRGLICHELMHKFWRQQMDKEEKEYWEIIYLQNQHYPDADEFFAEMNTYNFSRCLK